jgi:hypothetical protein
MSVWNRIGDVASSFQKAATDEAQSVFRGATNAVKFGGELLSGAGSTAKLGWDLGTAPWNSSDEYSGFIDTVRGYWNENNENIIKPLASAGGAIMKVPGFQPTVERINKINQEFIREPLTTFELVQGDMVKTDSLGTFFDPNEWRKAYKGAQEISYGQAVMSKYRSIYDPKFNVYDPAQREQAFKNSAWGKALSGGFDLGIQFVGDVTVVAGKGIKVLKAGELGVGKLTNADVVAKAAEDITKAQYGVTNRFTKVLDDFTKNDSAYAISHPMVKSSTNPGLLAHLLGDSIDRDETALILRSALSDPAAMDELRLQRAYITDALEAARGKMSAVDEFKLFSAPDGTGMIPFLNDSPAVAEEAIRNYESLAKTDKYFANLMEVSKGGGALTRTTGIGLQGVEDLVAKSRAVKFYDKTVGNAKVEVFQPTPFHRMYQKISWNQNQRPAGLVDFNDPDSYKEILATINVIGPDTSPRLTQKSLRGLNLFDEQQSKTILDKYMAAATPEQKFVAVRDLETTVFRTLAKKYDIPEKIADDIYNNWNGARTSALKSIKDKGFMVDVDESILKIPQFESQTANYLPLMDFELMNRLLERNKSVLKSFVGTPVQATLHYADILQDAFKAGALLRLGYTMRNGIDSQLRIAASVGSFATLRHLGPGFKNLLDNTVAVPARLVDRYAPVDSGKTLKQVQQASVGVVDELNVLKKDISVLETKLSLNPDDLDLAGKLNTFKELQKEKLAVYNHYANLLNRSKNADPKARIGTGSFEAVTSDGQKYVLDDAFGGPLGDMFRKIASSGNSFERLVDSNTDMYMRKVSSTGIGAIRPTDPGYFEQWAQTLRTQFGNSAVIKKIIAGESLDDISRWLRNTPEGRNLRSRLGIQSDEAAEYVTKSNQFLDQYLPATSNLRDKLSDITAGDLRSTFKDPTELPVIHGHILKEQLFNPSDKNIKKFINGAFKMLATLPEDAWARNPLYINFYRQEAKRRVDIVAGLKGDRISVADQEEIMMAAHKVALREMKNVLFNIERKSNLAAAMKYISPFFSAQENAYKTWFKMAVANPAIVNRGYLVWNSPNKAGLVTDQEGKEVPAGQTSGNDIIWIGLPKGVTKIPFIGKGLESFTTPQGKAGEGVEITGGFGIPKASLDIVFQGGMDVLYMKGNPNVFSDIFPVGPYVGVPVSEIVKRQPSLEESFKWALPFGPTKNAASGFLPTWFQRLQTRYAGQSDPQFANSYQLIYNTEQQKAKRNGLPPVDPNKILKMTRDYWKMRTAANLIMPFAPRFDTPYRFYMDKSREYKRVYGINADAQFFQDFPEFFSFSASLSSNPTSVQYSVQAVGNIKKYEGLVGELAKIEPKLVGLVVNNPSGYDFSQAAYRYLYGKKVSPDSPEKFLSSQSPAEAQKKNEAEKGWIQYNRFINIIDEELKNRGLTSVQQNGAEDLKIVKDSFIQNLSIQTDNDGKPVFNEKTGTFQQTAWSDDYLDSDGSKTNKVISGLSKILNNKKFMEDNKNNTTWKSVSVYFDIRKAMANELMKREVKSIDAKANTDIRFAYDSVVSKLKKDDPVGFAYLYDRFLSQDLIVDKYLTPVTTEKGIK